MFFYLELYSFLYNKIAKKLFLAELLLLKKFAKSAILGRCL